MFYSGLVYDMLWNLAAQTVSKTDALIRSDLQGVCHQPKKCTRNCWSAALGTMINSEDIALYIVHRTFFLKTLGVSIKREKINRFIFRHDIKFTESKISCKTTCNYCDCLKLPRMRKKCAKSPA